MIRIVPIALSLAAAGAAAAIIAQETPEPASTTVVFEVKGLGSQETPLRGVLQQTQSGLRRVPPVAFAVRGDGEVEVGPLMRGGEWRLTIIRPVPQRSFNATILHRPVEVVERKPNRVILDFGSGHKVAGEVRGPDGAPLAEVAVMVAPEGKEKIRYGALTGPDGRYSIHVPEEGTYQLTGERFVPRTAPG